nr:hypothetical protein [Pseudomonas agarici]
MKQWRDQEYTYDAWGNLIEKRSGMNRLQTFSYDIQKAPSAGTSAVPGRISNPVFLSLPILKLAYEMRGHWSLGVSIRVSIGS